MFPGKLKLEEFGEVFEIQKKFYTLRPEIYSEYESQIGKYEGYRNFIIKNIDFNPEMKILDFGSASYVIPNVLSEVNFKEIYGLDIFSDEHYSEYKSKIIKPNTFLVNYDGKKIPFDDNTFDVVSSLCVLEHIVYVEKIFDEFDRVVKKNGYIVIRCPNWSGINNPVRALISLIVKKERYWRYDEIGDAVKGFYMALKWYLTSLIRKNPDFVMIWPRIKNNEIDFERSDDDVVHLCQPLTIKKYFLKKGYKIIKYNRFEGDSLFAKIFNTLFPSIATTNSFVFKKL